MHEKVHEVSSIGFAVGGRRVLFLLCVNRWSKKQHVPSVKFDSERGTIVVFVCLCV